MVKWSFSGLKQFVNCPRQYHEVKILQNYPVEESEQMLYGSAVHKALEDYVRDGTPLAKNYKHLQSTMDGLIDIPGERYAELKMALKEDKTPCGFDDPEYWARGIVDLLIMDGTKAYIIDYKTGKPRNADTKQLKLMALMTFAHFSEITDINAALLFLSIDKPAVIIDEQYQRESSQGLWDAFNPSLLRMQVAYNSQVWSPNPTPLCGYCPVKSCDYHKPRRRF